MPLKLPLSFAQQRLWFLTQLEGVSSSYHIPLGFRLLGPLDKRAWRRTLDTIVARHEALRTVFVAAQGEPQVEIQPATTGFTLLEHDLEHEPEAEKRLAQLSVEESQAPFDLARGPLIRGRLIRLRTDDHVFLLTQHHIVSDGWSIGVFTRELTTLYAAFAAGQDNPLPPLQIQYPDYAAWQREWLTGERRQAHTSYWREQLKEAPALLELPVDRPRPAQQTFQGESIAIELDAELTRVLKHLSQRHGTTLFMTVLAAWATVLGKLSGQGDVVIGVPTANRTRREVEGLIGFFVNTLALRIDLKSEPSVTELLKRVRKTVLGAIEHQDLPFEQVAEIVQPPRQMAHAPVFQVLFAWQNVEPAELELPGLSVAPVAVEANGVKCDLELILGEENGCIVGRLLYAAALFDAATMERQVGYLRAQLRAMAADDRQPIGRADLLSQAERQLLRAWNEPTEHRATDRCIHQLFEEQARKTPDALAVVHDDDTLTYAELNRQANRVAHHLIALGVRPEARIAICVDRHPGIVVAILAALKAGGAYVPLDPTDPAKRLRELVRDVRPALIVVDAAGRRTLGVDACEGVATVGLEDLVVGAGNVTDPDVAGLTAANLAYLIYTSGSTGKPKGVMVEHAQVVRLFEATQGWYGFDEQDVWCLYHSVSFDFSVWELWGALRFGGRLVIVPREVARSPSDFHRLVCAAGVTVLNQTPSAFRGFIDEQLRSQARHRLRYTIFGGEALEPSMLSRWNAAHEEDSPRLVNMYGITETTVHVTYRPLEKQDAARPGSPIGRRIGDLRLYLLDRYGDPVPLGVVGELHVGGAGVARGYFERPELTAERFLPDPFAQQAGARMYRTGDLARYRRDGELEFLGRNDQQVKIRGYRIELGEIEARLVRHPAIREAAVIARADVTGEKRLLAYVTTQPGAGNSAVELVKALRQHVAEELPAHMVPAAFLILKSMPLTPNGKLDRDALPKPNARDVAHRPYEAPHGAVEEKLAAIWSDLLGLERVGRNDDFFELGGSSLGVMRLLTCIETVFAISIPVTRFYSNPVFSNMASQIEMGLSVLRPAGQQLHKTSCLVPIEQTSARIGVFCVHAGGGYVWDYRDLARELAKRGFSVSGFQARGLGPDETPIDNVPRMAQAYVEAMRAVQPRGPYLLAGYCIGGSIAVEMAHLIQTTSAEPVCLSLINTIPFQEPVNELGLLLQAASTLNLEVGAAELLEATAGARLADLLWQNYLEQHATLAQQLGRPQFERVFRVHAAIRRAIASYRPSSFAGPATLFVSEDRGEGDATVATSELIAKWREVLPQVEPHPVSGSHSTMMLAPHARQLANRLAERWVHYLN